MKFLVTLLGLLCFSMVSASEILFATGSCNKQNKNQSYWEFIGNKNPDLFVWLGDNIYADYANEQERRFQYLKQKTNPFYYKFSQSVPVTGIWDDHDYGFNNAGSNFKGKKGSKGALLDFFNEPFDTDVDSHEGIYRKFILQKDDLKIAFFLLDTRYFMIDSGPNKTILGKEQRSWLEREFEATKADVFFIASGVHVTTDFTFHERGLEGWKHFTKDRKFLFDLISRKSSPVVFLSGDRHSSSLSRRVINRKPVYELMASGLTHSYSGPMLNRFRVSPFIKQTNHGVVKVIKSENGEITIFFSVYSNQNDKRLFLRKVRFI